jgi:MYXO-CTERM domain-containing protein
MKPFRRINSFPISETRWLAYVTAGAASALACANSAEAEIHYSGNVFIKLTGNAQASLPLSNGASLVFRNIFGGSTFLQHFHFYVKGVISGSARGYFQSASGSRNWLSNLPPRENVSAGEFLPVTGNPGFGVLFTFWSDGAFSPIGGWPRGFVGFRFNTGNGMQYGWARIQTRDVIINHSHHVRDVIEDYAWGDVGDSIRTGQKSSSGDMVNAVTDSGSVGLLALGAAGLVAWRKRRELVTQ